MTNRVPVTRAEGTHSGYRLIVAGLLACGLAMVVGLLLAISLHFWGDPENPSQVFAYAFAAVLLAFCLGGLAGVLGVVLLAFQVKPVTPVSASTKPGGPQDDDAVDEKKSGADDASASTQSWDEAYAADHRRRL